MFWNAQCNWPQYTEKFEDTKGQTMQWPKEKGQKMISTTLHRKLKIEQHDPQ